MGRRSSLLIGNSHYQDDKLARLLAPSTDIEHLARVLSTPSIGGFTDVDLLLNESSARVRKDIAIFFGRDRRADDLLLLYFSGHGVRDDQGALYLAVQDTDSQWLSATAIPAAFVTSAMDQTRSKRVVLILDCCHSGAVSPGAKAITGGSAGTAPAFAGSGFGHVVLTASDATQYAFEGDRIVGKPQGSVFTRHLIEGLETGAADVDGDGKVTVDDAYSYVYEQVVQENPRQTPLKFTYKQRGDFVIALNPRPVVKPAELPPDDTVLRDDERGRKEQAEEDEGAGPQSLPALERPDGESPQAQQPRSKWHPLVYLLWLGLVVDTGLGFTSLVLVRRSAAYVITALLGLLGVTTLIFVQRRARRRGIGGRFLALGSALSVLTCLAFPVTSAIVSNSLWNPWSSRTHQQPLTRTQLILKDNPVAYLQMNETAGVVAHDSSPSGHNGSYQAQVGLGSPGVSGSSSDKAAALRGDDGYISLPSVGPLQHGRDRTIEFWLKTAQTDQRNVLTTGEPGHATSLNIALLGPRGPEEDHCGSQRMAGLYVDFFDNDVHLPGVQLADNNWHYVAITVFGGGRKVNVVVDGRQPQGYIWNGLCFTPTLQSQPFQMPWPIDTTPGPIELGRSSRLATGQGGGVHYPGVMGSLDEFVIYPTALEPSRLVSHFGSRSAAQD